ncbi:MAG: ATP-dependent DNA helicase DinG [Psychromonas sp.]|nr:ATP-dependent DNA helicase DinG [Psychromonas sp.]
MLSDTLKKQIRSNYTLITKSLPDFQIRKEQNLLVAEIAKVLTGEYDKFRRILVVEAGTGIGKSLAYILSALPVAQAQKKKLVISTATITLQEQLIKKELPFFIQHSLYQFSFTLAKGRQRYCCEHKLLATQETPDIQDNRQGFLFEKKPKSSDIAMLKRLNNAYLDGNWQGDRDSWTSTIPEQLWQHIVSDKHSCKRAHASHRHCPFHRSRDEINKSDVIVVNHALLLADLALGGGIILPSPDRCFYILDEAHHLPSIARDFSNAQSNIKGSIEWLKKLPTVKRHIDKIISSNLTITPSLTLIESAIEIEKHLITIKQFFENNPYFLGTIDQHRFKNGKMPHALHSTLCNLRDESKRCLSALNKLCDIINSNLTEANINQSDGESLLIEAGGYLQRLDNMFALWKMLSKEIASTQPPIAAWVSSKENDLHFSACPIEVGALLENIFWKEASGVVLCSATLTSLNSFSYFKQQSGLTDNDGTQYLRLKSPFDYPSVSLIIAKMDKDPTQNGFDNELALQIDNKLIENTGNLVLFSSYRQMHIVADKLAKKYQAKLLVQGDLSRSKLIETHKKRCDNGETSILFATSGLSEGLDLPGHYLTNLIVTKLPFPVPNSPVEAAHSEWITQQGGNPFMKLSIPQASKKLIQSTGRLIRKENDTGRIIILDKRVLSKHYGKALLDALPPFKIQIEK